MLWKYFHCLLFYNQTLTYSTFKRQTFVFSFCYIKSSFVGYMVHQSQSSSFLLLCLGFFCKGTADGYRVSVGKRQRNKVWNQANNCSQETWLTCCNQVNYKVPQTFNLSNLQTDSKTLIVRSDNLLGQRGKNYCVTCLNHFALCVYCINHVCHLIVHLIVC